MALTEPEYSSQLMNLPWKLFASCTHPTICICLLVALTNTGTAQERLQANAIFDPGHIVEVAITMKPEEWTQLRNQNRDIFQAFEQHASKKVFTYFKASVVIDGKKIDNVGVRKKGFLGSLDSSRPSLKIKFNEFQDQTPAEGFDRLTLNNNKQDPSRLCQYLSYRLFNEAGVQASRCNLARVTVNGKYLGVYSNVESVKSPFLEARFGDKSGALFEGTTTDFFPNSVDRFEAKNDGKYDILKKLAKVLDQDKITYAEVDAIVDVEQFVRYWVVESLIGFWDGYASNQNNFFVYQDPRNKKLYFMPWGVDAAFTNFIPLPQLRPEVKSVHAQSVLANRLYRLPEIQKLYLATMQETMAKIWQEDKLQKEIDAAVELVKPQILGSNRGFRVRVAEIKGFVKGRRATINRELKTGAAKISHGARRPFFFENVGTAVGSFDTTWANRTPSNPSKVGRTTLKVMLNGKPLEFSRLGVTAEPSQDPNGREADGRMPPALTFHGLQKSNNRAWMVSVNVNSSIFRPTKSPSSVAGIVIEGNPLWFFAKFMLLGGKFEELTLVGGEVQFDEAKREVGAPVRGKVKFKIGNFKGGDHMPVR